MTPPAVVLAALVAGLDMIAICDHNSEANVAAVQEAAGDLLTVVPGIEITTAEEVHVVGLFPNVETAEVASDEISLMLPEADEFYYSFFGEQLVMDCEGNLIRGEAATLVAATSLDLNDTVAFIKKHRGLAIAAHIDRRAFGVMSQLGWFPTDAGFDAVEVSRHTTDDAPRMAEFRGFGLAITGSSDSHYLNDIGRTSALLDMYEPTFDELVLAVYGVDGRQARRA
jgi:hypothetical protein